MAIATLAERGELSRAARTFLRTEAGSAVLLLAAAVLALLWTNVVGGYEQFWHAELTLTLAGAGFGLDLRHWVNDGLMVLFFLSVGLEIARETTLGELRGVRAVMAPAFGALGGLAVPAGVYLLFNAGGPGAAAWGVPISTDTAVLLGVLALSGRGARTSCGCSCSRWRSSTTSVRCSRSRSSTPTRSTSWRCWSRWACSPPCSACGSRTSGGPRSTWSSASPCGWPCCARACTPASSGCRWGCWRTPTRRGATTSHGSGSSAAASCVDPTADRAAAAQAAVTEAVSPNERLQLRIQPWSSYVIVPLFVLANAGVAVTGETLRAAVGSPITWGIVVGLVVGKPIG